MSEGFLRFRRRFVISAYLKSGVFGLSTGLLTSSLIITLNKIFKNDAGLLLALLLGLAAAAIGFAVMLVIVFPRKRSLAKRLDNELFLNERAQTMLEFIDDNSDMAVIQRADTNERLLALPKSSLKEKRLLLHIIAPLLAVAMLMPAIFIPIKADAPATPPEEPPYEVTDWQKAAVRELIVWVKDSSIEDEPKEATVLKLEQLVVSLDTPKPISTLKIEIYTVISDLYEEFKKHDTYSAVALTLLAAENEDTKFLGAAVGTLSGVSVREQLDKLRVKLTKDYIKEFEGALSSALASVEVYEADTLLPSFVDFCSTLNKIHTLMDTYTDQWYNNSIDEAFKLLFDEVNAELFAQNENEKGKKYVASELKRIFGLSDAEMPNDSSVGGGSQGGENGEYGDDDDDNPLHGGGLGSGNQEFGSDDIIYDPVNNRYVTYGELLNEYFAKVSEQLLDGGTSSTLEEFISKYYSSLYDGSKKDN